MKQYRVLIQPEGRQIDVQEGSTLMKTLKEAEIDLDFPCGGGGKCGKCRVRILEGNVESSDMEKRFLQEKEIQEGIHLACFTKIYSDISVEVSKYNPSQHNILLANQEMQVKIEPHICKKYVEIEKPSLGDHRSDWNRLCDKLIKQSLEDIRKLEADIQLLRKLPETIREAKYNLTAVTYGCEVLEIEGSDTTQRMLGMAFDIGTTTVVGYLMELNEGKELSVVSTLNPQTKYGADVITRTNFASRGDSGLKTLQSAMIKSINNLITEAVEKAGVDRGDIYAITIAGNTCMHHLFLGLSPRYIGQSPYIPVISEPVVLGAADLHIDMNEVGKVLVLPNIAGFVGADTVAVLLATEMDASEDIKLMIDIGTNGEIALGGKDKLFACSAAAGPAFEGAQISSGMRGAVGAIDHISFDKTLSYSVIGGVKPQGICGSGLLDAVAGLLDLGMIDKRGNFISQEKEKKPEAEAFIGHIVQHEGMKAFLLVDEASTSHGRPILITQQDIRQLQLAKGAMAAGIKILLEKQGISVEDVKEVLLAGAFGNYLNPHSACGIGLIPKELEGKIKMIGNAAGTGAKLALLSANQYKRAASIAASVEYVELASYPGFTNIFAKSMYL
ncbi:Uncharacterized 2Fe-2 and 4Fe-4S clusters-containing protein, contains DUF4445 domain [Anaerovirgula multivorans]|uniref:Uncharacterized 2Fe-2 and 4Fe-4S clusters-containing protein, contains DUF4445 domain n=1 Tax=Anaerovirgula multivorans TaxID=312168 RepID=A0A239BEZ7_9FIRM|nr:ASKHA domain-containing protein [Anaerovirgula multivorans]SNS06595.1 Uncharacterized 2Fe-2 and 4Fe-4S clusters-containing protein, contains DUF4445 domain [Anaerovirgula multivorans]